MRTTLVFPPPASPTYVPLGLASLVSYLRASIPQAEVSVCDLNIALWCELAGRDQQSRALLDFMRRMDDGFLDPAAYCPHQPTWGLLAGQVAEVGQQVRSYLRTGQCPDSLATLLGAWTVAIDAHQPDVIGFSVMFLDQVAFAVALARWMRELAGKSGRPPRLVLGGAAMSALDIRELLQAAPFLDGILPGEGEQALALLCQGAPLTAIPGMQTASGPGSDSGVTPMPLPTDVLGTPDFGVFDLSRYFNPTPVLPVVLSRDCEWRRCRFCAHNLSFQGYRRKEVRVFIDEIETLMARHNARHFYLADQYVSATTLEQLSDEILRRGLSINFHLMARPTQDHTPRRLAKAAAAGCRWISWGIETGSQRLLNLVRKGTRRDMIERLMAHSHDAGIANLMMMIFGLPTSTHTDLEQTFDLIDQVCHLVAAIKSSSFVLFQGTPFAHHPQRFGLSVTGRETLLHVGSAAVHSNRLQFMARASDGTLMPPPGPLEVSRWMQRRRWLAERSFLDTLCCEHFLLYCSKAKADDQDHPLRPLPRRAA